MWLCTAFKGSRVYLGDLAKAIEADQKPGLSELLLSLVEQIAKAVGHIPVDDAYTITAYSTKGLDWRFDTGKRQLR